MATSLSDRLELQRQALAAFLRRQGSGLLRFEELDDLVQGVITRALTAAAYEDRGEQAFVGWLRTLARRHLADRHAHWMALKRGAGQVLRFTTTGDSESGGGALQPVAPGPGPRTFAEGREQLVLATKALDTLPDRDRRLVRWMSEGVSLSDQAERLELGHDAAQRAAHRALQRFRKAYRVLSTTG